MKKLLLILIILSALTFCTEQNKEALKETKAEALKENIVRKGEIDVVTLDENGDEKLWQCPMDWNVLDDKAGNCPVCGMKLKEYTLDETKANLIKHGHKVKGHETPEGVKDDHGQPEDDHKGMSHE